jgi:succinyl-CoA synthetase beta subunit
MKIHEHQAKQLMAARGMSVPRGRVARSVDEAVAAVRPLIEETANPIVVLKSQRGPSRSIRECAASS